MKFTRAERRSAIIISQAIAWLVINRSAKFEQRLPERRIKCTESTSRDIIPLSRPRKIIPLVSRDSPLPPPPSPPPSRVNRYPSVHGTRRCLRLAFVSPNKRAARVRRGGQEPEVSRDGKQAGRSVCEVVLAEECTGAWRSGRS